jgi:hypothetical protein
LRLLPVVRCGLCGAFSKAQEWKLIRTAPKIKLVAEKERSLRLDDEAERRLLAEATKRNWQPQTLALFRDVVILVRDTGMRNEKELYQIRIWLFPSKRSKVEHLTTMAGKFRQARTKADLPKSLVLYAAAMTSARAC